MSLNEWAEKITMEVYEVWRSKFPWKAGIKVFYSPVFFKPEIVIVGHNPGLTSFANRLLDDSIENIPTCGIVASELTIDAWDELDWGCGETKFFDVPK